MDYVGNLNPEQRMAVEHQYGPLLILAGAGSGKTRVITHRIAYLIDQYNVSPYHILAITFTNKAAKEMRDRVNSLVDYGAQDIWVSTFHSACVRMLRRFCDAIGYEKNFSVYDTDDQKSLMRTILKSLNIDTKKMRESFFLNRISTAKNELVGPDRYREEYGRDRDADLVVSVYREYQKRLLDQNAMDFDDLLFNTVEMFRQSESALTYYRNRFRYIMVDEYQDTNTAQFELIRLLAHYTNDEGEVEHNLCVVGDDDQSIYGFRGANIRNILNFEKYYPDAVVIKLEENYRSTETILDAANEVIKNNFHTNTKTLWTKLGKGTPITYTVYPDAMSEAEGAADEIRRQVDAGEATYNSFAVLYRTNAQSRAFEIQFSKNRIPCRVVGGVNFYQRKEIKDILAYLRTIDNGRDSVAVRRILNVPKRGIGDTTANAVQDFTEINDCSFYDALTYADHIPTIKAAAAKKIKPFVELIEKYRERAAQKNCCLKNLVTDLIADLDYEEELKREDEESFDDRKGNIDEFITSVAQYEITSDEPPTLAGFLSEVSLVTDLDSVEEDPDYVVLMTIHSAKGLEFDQVFLAGMEDNLFPSSMSLDDPNGIEEERRLCYVGITRARKRLYLSRARERMLRGETSFNPESRFVLELKRQARHLITEKSSGSGGFFGGSSQRTSGSLYDLTKNSSGRSYSGGGNSYSNSYGSSGGSYRDSYGGSSERRGGRNSDWDDMPFAGSPKPAVSASKPYVNPYISTSAPASRNFGSGDASSLGFAVGDRVKHVKFGIGTVEAIVKGGKDFEVTVDFPSGRKKMLASFAKLEKV
ncbi:MAG: UvrD-helicase domain-containing protein [Lachnospiraceae bacterium]|nr:UvrD-helicase domain-containing protein [Lachnospiraceae bacterium]